MKYTIAIAALLANVSALSLNKLSDQSFIQMSNGSIREIDPVDDTMRLIQKNDKFRPGSYAEINANSKYEMSPLDIKETRDSNEVT